MVPTLANVSKDGLVTIVKLPTAPLDVKMAEPVFFLIFALAQKTGAVPVVKNVNFLGEK